MADAACVCLVFLMAVTFFDVVGRYFFNSPLTFSVELIELGMGLLVMLGIALTTLNGGHITVDLLKGAVPGSVNAVLARIASLTAVVSLGLMAYWLWDRAAHFLDDGLATQILFLPVFPFVFVMAFAAAVAALVAVYQLYKPPDDPEG